MEDSQEKLMKHIRLGAAVMCCASVSAVCGAEALPIDTMAADTTKTKTVTLHEVVKVGNANSKLNVSAMGITKLSQAAIIATPTMFGEADVIKALQLQPGVSAGVEGFAGMMVRGGGNDQNLFLIDGNPIYQMNHLGGLFSAYNTSAIDQLTFYKATFPARYGGRLSSVIDISSKNGDYENHHGTVSVGLLAANLFFSGPIVKNRTSYAVGLRRSWMELATVPALAIINASKKRDGEKVIGGYSFTDFNLKINQRIGAAGTLSLLGYYGYDRLKVGEHQFSTAEHESDESYLRKDENRLGWGNMLVALGYSQQLSSVITIDMSIAYTRYKSKYRQTATTERGDIDDSEYESESSQRTELNSINDISAKCALQLRPRAGISVRAGVDYTHHHFSPEQVSENSTDAIIDAASGASLDADECSVYADGEFSLLPWMKWNVGVRSSIFHLKHKTYATMEPRASVNFKVSPAISFKAGYARMSQFVQQVSDNYISLPTDYWMPISDRFGPLTSSQVSAGAYLSLLGGKCEVSLEGYYKKMNNLLEYCEEYNLMPSGTLWSDRLVQGEGRAWGIDLQIEKNLGRVSGFVGYGLMWSDRLFAELNQGRRFPSKYDNRHKINVYVSWQLSKRVEINAAWTYMTGNRATISLENYAYAGNGLPTTIAPAYPKKDEEMLNYFDGKNNVRLPAYHRLDLGLNIKMPKKNGREGIWNVSIYNAYSRMNPIMIEKNNDKQTVGGTSLKPRFRSLSLFPIIPSVSYIYKF